MDVWVLPYGVDDVPGLGACGGREGGGRAGWEFPEPVEDCWAAVVVDVAGQNDRCVGTDA